MSYIHIHSVFVIICLLFLGSISVHAVNSDYPKTREERRNEEIGSVVGGEGVVFRPGKVKNESTKAAVSEQASAVNKYLWQAAREVLTQLPLINVDSNSGTLSTDWYQDKQKPGYSHKINVFIHGDVISPENLEVKAFERADKTGASAADAPKVAAELEDKILRKARDLYIQSDRKGK